MLFTLSEGTDEEANNGCNIGSGGFGGSGSFGGFDGPSSTTSSSLSNVFFNNGFLKDERDVEESLFPDLPNILENIPPLLTCLIERIVLALLLLRLLLRFCERRLFAKLCFRAIVICLYTIIYYRKIIKRLKD